MKFKGEPNLFVRINIKFHQRLCGRKGFSFDANGEFETENLNLINLLKRSFEEVKEEAEKAKTFKCKKCDFETENSGQLMAHYRKEHKKE
jgi:hypothetical protein